MKEQILLNETMKKWNSEEIESFNTLGKREVLWVEVYSKQCVKGSDGLSCYEYDPIYGVLTFTYINLPGSYILSCFIGPLSAGIFGGIWGINLIIIGKFLGLVIEECQVFQMTLYSHSLGLFIVSLTQAPHLVWRILHRSVRKPKVKFGREFYSILDFRVLEKTARGLFVS